jgi:methyl-accepting chemotaxis protein
MSHLKLGGKFLIGGLFLLVIPLCLIEVVMVLESTRSITNQARNDLSTMAEGLAGTLSVGMNEQLVAVRNAASRRTFIATAEKVARLGADGARDDLARMQADLLKIKEIEGERCSGLIFVGKDGIGLASSNPANVGLDFKGRDYATEALKGNPNVGSVGTSRSTGMVVCMAAAPVYAPDGKGINGIIAMGLEIKYLTDIVDAIKIGTAGYATVAQKNGIIIAHPVRESILKEDISKTVGMETVAKMVAAGKTGIVEYKRFGMTKVASLAAVPLPGWSVLVTIDRVDMLSSVTNLRNLIVTIGVLFLAIASVFLYLFSRNLSAPLNKVVRAAEEIASGNLSVELGFASRYDEVGSLSRAFALMADSLKEMAHVAERIASGDLTVEVRPQSEKDILGNAFQAMVAKLKSHMSGISEGFAVLTAAASEILAATTQVVSGTAETAAAISETTATVEEVRQAARLSSEKAKNVSSNAQRVTQASQSGQGAVEDTAAVMLRIRDQMETIARTIVRLSEQSQSIGGIIASVTDLADQSNLLAVNASIEAARAGEQGKGFTVIALEIKSLAEQSKQATTQVREILSEVQKATGAAVMATEQGTKAVEAGVKQSCQAGDAIRVLAESSTEATQAATQIVSSSQQQVIGMDQVGIAMQNISQAGAQTAASMRQAETAAQNLHELGQRLKALVEQYKT